MHVVKVTQKYKYDIKKNKIGKLKSDLCDAVNSKIVDVGKRHHHFLCSSYQCMKKATSLSLFLLSVYEKRCHLFPCSSYMYQCRNKTLSSFHSPYRQVIMVLTQLERSASYHLSRRLIHRMHWSPTGLADWAGAGVNHDPPLTLHVEGLHAPRPLQGGRGYPRNLSPFSSMISTEKLTLLDNQKVKRLTEV